MTSCFPRIGVAYSNLTTVPGDSGAWIYNSSTLQLCGHVLAWSNQRKVAYIAPMEVLFEDIKRRLNADHVCLPDTKRSQAEVDGGSTVMRSGQRALAETRSTELNRQLEMSREVELGLREMRASDEASTNGPAKAKTASQERHSCLHPGCCRSEADKPRAVGSVTHI